MLIRTIRLLVGTAVLVTVLAACAGNTDTEPSTAATSTIPGVTAPSPDTPEPNTAVPPTSSSTSQPDPTWAPPPVCDGPCDAPLEVLFTVPTGNDGVGYADIDREELLGWGPNAIALDAKGHVWIADTANNQLLAFTLEGAPVVSVDLSGYEVASALDIAASGNGRLLLLDIHVATERYRLLELDSNGGLIAAHDLPLGVRLADGLTGVATSPSGQLWLELEVGTSVAVLDTTSESVEYTIVPGYPYPTGTFGPVADDPFSYQAADVLVDVATSRELGGLTLLGVNRDGSFVLLLDEVDTDATTGAFLVDETVHLFDQEGNHLGEAIFPLNEQYAGVDHPLAVGPDGNTYGLLTRPDHVAVAVLHYSR